MSKVLNLINKRFGRLLVIKRVNNDKWGGSKWLCKCDCGNEIIVLRSCLTQNHTKSCGCYRKETAIKQVLKNHKSGVNAPNYKHGNCLNKSTITYNSWAGMIQRCTNKNSAMYKYYGGRNIKICKRWMKSFKIFLNDMKEKPNKNYHIHRKDNNKNYSKLNCEWKLASNHISDHKGNIKCAQI